MASLTSRNNRPVQTALSRTDFCTAAIVVKGSDAMLPFGKTFGLGKGVIGLKILAHWQTRGPCDLMSCRRLHTSNEDRVKTCHHLATSRKDGPKVMDVEHDLQIWHGHGKLSGVTCDSAAMPAS